MTEEACNYLVEFGKASSKWRKLVKDKLYSTVDLHLNEELPNVYSELEFAILNHIMPKVEKEWLVPNVAIRQLFMVYYSKKVQTNLKLHHDDSFITMSVKLNNEYTGAELYFPRQKFSNKTIPVGNILIWPSQITHPHQCTTLESGEKFSLTVWTHDKSSAD
jgi:hypothetical protein